MKTVTVQASNPISEDLRANTLQYLQNSLNDDELERLGRIAKSTKARKYLNGSFGTLKLFLGL